MTNPFVPRLALLLVLLFGGRAAADSPPALQLDVDARELPRHLVHVRMTLPCPPGKTLRVWYPRWLPGTHAPAGRVENVVGVQFESVEGKTLPWKRDEVDLHCFEVEPPRGTAAVRARFDYIVNPGNADASGHDTVTSRCVGVLNWQTCFFYPEGVPVGEQRVRARLALPRGWKNATPLKADAEGDGWITFQETSLEDLADNPVIAAEHLRTFPLAAGNGPPAFLHVASESPSATRLDAKVVDLYGRVVREAVALFGTAHYPEYHFLVTCSDDLGYFGLEHHSCSLNGVRERDLLDDKKRTGWVANLLPHEYAHSWCGKYRRPAAMCTPDFHTPQKTKLLWVYEGLTMYLGDVLMVRAGLVEPKEYLEMLALTVGDLLRREGRRWRPLEDTAVASSLLRSPSPHWNDLRREQDYYPEGLLLWLEADAIIRDQSQGKRSLDDFCKQFLGSRPEKGKVVPYDQVELVKLLKGLADHDWEAFFARRVTATQETLPLDVLGRCGYRLRYADKPSGFLEKLEAGKGKRDGSVGARDSLGLTFAEDGKVLNVHPGMPGAKAGLVVGMQVLGVNGRKFSRQRLLDALADSPTLHKVELLLLEGDAFRTVVVEYADGPRYLELARDPDKPDYLADVLRPLAAK
jgi:predicted metalloprotease with PDZ domain